MIHSATVAWLLAPVFQVGSTPFRNRALTTLSVPGILSSRGWRTTPGWTLGRCGRGCWMPAKNTADSQNWLRVHLAKGWAWHWAHSSLTPRNTRAVVPARVSALVSLARENAAGE